MAARYEKFFCTNPTQEGQIMKILFCVLFVSVAALAGWALGDEVESPSPDSQAHFSAFIGCSPMTITCGAGSCPFAAAGSAPDARTISVAGTAVMRTMPDTIVWRISTSDFDKDLISAKESSDRKLKAILGLREGLKIDKEDLETGHLSIRREYEYDERGHQKAFKHFAVTRSVTVRQRDVNRFDEFFSKLVSSAEMEVSVSFESSRLHELRAQTRLKALRIAQEKAEAMLKELGVNLGKVIRIDEHRPTGQPFGPMSNAAFFDAGSAPEVDTAGGTFAPGAIEVRVTVYVTFAIE
jgi:uncharacterized protein